MQQRRIKAYEYEGSHLVEYDLGEASPEMPNYINFSHSHGGRTYDFCSVEPVLESEEHGGFFVVCVLGFACLGILGIAAVAAIIDVVITVVAP